MNVHICSFEAVDLPHGKALTYEVLKAAVLKAGRFSCFEATDTQLKARLFTQLCRDPEIETLQEEHGFAYPWTGVRVRERVEPLSPRAPRTLKERVEGHGAIPDVAPVQVIVPDYPGGPEVATIHLGWGINSRGGVSSLCRPKSAMRLSHDTSWAFKWNAVTCVRCRAVGQSILKGEIERR